MVFPKKKEGDGLGAEHVNWLTEGVQKFVSNPHGVQFSPFYLQNFEVVEVECDGDPNLYRIVPRHWDNATLGWVSGNSADNRGFSLDATDTGQTYALEDKVQAYYDAQRGTYIPLATSGSSSDGSGSCPCTCIEEGDIEVGDIITTSIWTISMPSVRFEQSNGTITFPSGTYTVTYDSGSGTWTLDIGDFLTAAYNDGSDATVATTMDGTLTMSWGGSVAEVNLCVDGTIPAPP